MANSLSLGGNLQKSTGFGFNGPRSVGKFAPLESHGARPQIGQNNQLEIFVPERKHVQHGRSLKTVENNFEGVDKDVLDQYIAATKNPDGTVNENGVKALLEFLKTNNLVQDESSLIGTTFCFDHAKFNIWDRCMSDLNELIQTIQQKIAALESSSAGTTASGGLGTSANGVASTTANSEAGTTASGVASTTARGGLGTSANGVASTTANSEAVTTSRSGLGTSASSTQDLTTALRLLTTPLHLSSTPSPVGGISQPVMITNSTGHNPMELGPDIIVKTTLPSKETSTPGQTSALGEQGGPGHSGVQVQTNVSNAQEATPVPVSGGAPGQPAGSASIGLPERIGSYAGYGAFLLGILSLVKSYLNQSETTRLHEQYRLLQTQVPQAGNASVGRDMELGLDGSVSRVENTVEQDETQREDLNKIKEELNKLLEVFESLLPQVDPSHRLGYSLVGSQPSTHSSNQPGVEPVVISQSPSSSVVI